MCGISPAIIGWQMYARYSTCIKCSHKIRLTPKCPIIKTLGVLSPTEGHGVHRADWMFLPWQRLTVTFRLIQVMKELAKDVTNLDLSELMAEHLMGATFNAIRRQFDRDLLRLLQFTNTDITRGQLVEVWMKVDGIDVKGDCQSLLHSCSIWNFPFRNTSPSEKRRFYHQLDNK